MTLGVGVFIILDLMRSLFSASTWKGLKLKYT